MIPATIFQAGSSTVQPAASDKVSRFQQIIEEVNNPSNHILDKRCRNPKNTTKTNINAKVQSFNQRQHLPLQQNRK